MNPQKIFFFGIEATLEKTGHSGFTITGTAGFESEELILLSRWVKPGDRILTAGVGAGLTSLWAMLHGGVVIGYEANPALAKITLSQVRVGEEWINIEPYALWPYDGKGYLEDSGVWARDSVYEGEIIHPKDRPIKLVDINRAIMESQANALHLDVEGAEDILVPAIRTESWKQLRWVFLEVHHAVDIWQPEPMVYSMRMAGFKLRDLIYDDPTSKHTLSKPGAFCVFAR